MTSYSTTCAICLEDTLEVHTITLDCKHPFHAPCLSQLRTNKCPTCRRRFTNIHPEMLSKIKQREHDDILSRNAEDLNELWSNLISAGDGGPPPPPPPPNPPPPVPVRTSTRRLSCFRRSLWATPKRCSSSTTRRPRS